MGHSSAPRTTARRFLAICAGYQLLGEYFPDATSTPTPGLGILDVRTDRLPKRGRRTRGDREGPSGSDPHRLREPCRGHTPRCRRDAAGRRAQRRRQRGRLRGRHQRACHRDLPARAVPGPQPADRRSPARLGDRDRTPLHRGSQVTQLREERRAQSSADQNRALANLVRAAITAGSPSPTRAKRSRTASPCSSLLIAARGAAPLPTAGRTPPPANRRPPRGQRPPWPSPGRGGRHPPALSRPRDRPLRCA